MDGRSDGQTMLGTRALSASGDYRNSAWHSMQSCGTTVGPSFEFLLQGDFTQYRKLLADLREFQAEDAASVTALKLRLRALSQSVYSIDENHHQALLDHVLGMSVWIYEDDLTTTLLAFVVNLASSNGSCVGQCMDMLVRNFLPPSCGLASSLDTYSKASLRIGAVTLDQLRSEEEVHLARKERVMNRLHAAIIQIASLVPTMPLRLQPIVMKRMPHRSSAKVWTLLYLENMLRLEATGGRYLANQMLPTIVDYLTQVDVEIRWEDILHDEETGKVNMFHMDVEEDSEDWECNGIEPKGETGDTVGPGMEGKNPQGLLKTSTSQNKVATLDEMADKMDAMMDMTFTHLENAVTRGQTLQVYTTLMKSFQTTILQTHKSKFTQFLIFYLCALEPIACGSRFASLLCEIFACKSRPPVTRISAAAYLASYLARASFLSAHVICTCLKRMVSWCIAYDETDDITIAPIEGALHGVFFSVCQAIMYTLCFRFKMLVNDSEGKRVLRELPLKQLVVHRLNPMKVCLPSVVEEFLKKASILHLVDQQDWITSKARLRRASAAPIVRAIRLDMFFPFDPYLLRQSDRFIRPNFNFWYMVEPLGENAVSDLEDDYNDAGSDIPSDAGSLAYQDDEYAGSPGDQLEGESRIEDDCVHKKQLDVKETKTSRAEKTVETVQSSVKFVASSRHGGQAVADAVQCTFDAMSITPPEGLRMPRRLPMHVAAKMISVSSFHT